MSPKTINYDNTHFYKLCCKDINVKDTYIGHTTDFIRRKSQHKRWCKNEIYKEHNLKVYTFIRANGGWENWDMVLIEKCACADYLDAKRKERLYIEEHEATLNMYIPSRTQKEYDDIYRATDEYKQNQKLYRETNKDQLKAKGKVYREAHKADIKEKHRQHYYNNLDYYRDKHKNYRDTNRATLAFSKKLYYDANKDKILEHKRQYVEQNRDKINERQRLSYAEKKKTKHIDN